MFAVGLTGGIGSGKSTVAAMFAAHGAYVIDTDVIAHALTAPGGAAIEAIRAAFGDEVINDDGSLNRAAMRERVFTDPAQRHRLEAILHPRIRAEALRLARDATHAPYVIHVVPLLVESGTWASLVDRILVVDCDEAVQRTRVMKRSGLSLEQVQAIISAQASRAQRLAVANDVIDNSGATDSLAARVAALHETYCNLARMKGVSGH
ncbi:MAG TPA: dephospho-CoA kinase [Burkholderiaceae bacterium]|nr:dephospho-CoA kinase [Burkholderiaceae bacterium]